ncbi:zinc-binding dehydrogenase [Rhizobium azibense]|uniref:zinc-binding dehydrogenase n=1 Tax=Rhizobium azibense TaxID=1136135 RepID=UPI001052C071|nr:zinc-binding dehydrogenase [Rhizobium azibense]
MKVRPSGEQLAKLADLVDAGAVRPVIDTVYPFEQTPHLKRSRQGARSGSRQNSFAKSMRKLRAT